MGQNFENFWAQMLRQYRFERYYEYFIDQKSKIRKNKITQNTLRWIKFKKIKYDNFSFEEGNGSNIVHEFYYIYLIKQLITKDNKLSLVVTTITIKLVFLEWISNWKQLNDYEII